MNSVERLGKEAFAWQHEGALHIVAHGNRSGVMVGSRLLSPPYLAARIPDRMGKTFHEVKLYSCEAGAGSNPYIQRLAKELRVPVSGSADRVYTWPTPADLEQVYLEAGGEAQPKSNTFTRDCPRHLHYSAPWSQARPL